MRNAPADSLSVWKSVQLGSHIQLYSSKTKYGNGEVVVGGIHVCRWWADEQTDAPPRYEWVDGGSVDKVTFLLQKAKYGTGHADMITQVETKQGRTPSPTSGTDICWP